MFATKILLVCGVVALLMLPGVAGQPRKGFNGVRGKIAQLANSEECLYCQILAVPIDFENPSSPDVIQFDCLTDVAGEVGILAEIPYQIALPQAFVEEHNMALQSGLSTVCIPGGRAIRLPDSPLPDQIVFPEGADIQLLPETEEPEEGEGLGLGNRTVLIVRVSGSDDSPEESVETLAGAVFGLGSQALTNSMRAQFQRCSFSKIDFLPASSFSQLNNGVLDIQLNYSLRGKNTLRVWRHAQNSVARQLRIDSFKRNFHHVMFCIARGTTHGDRGTEWLAFAHIKHYFSVFNSMRCASLSVLMHEIGHNLGLMHSAGDITGDPYGDTTGVMGYSEATVDGPLKCFNPNKNWLLGWYKDKALTIGAGECWTGRLVAFVDYDLADPSNDEVVLLKLQDYLYAQYNRATQFNAGTSEHRDEVLVVVGEGGLTASSVLRAGLGNRESYSSKGMTIEVHTTSVRPPSVDYAEVSVYPTDGLLACNFAPSAKPTPIFVSTPRPSPRALMPTPPPSFTTPPQPIPVLPAPVSPSLRPTSNPTPIPSPLPTVHAPTSLPTPRLATSAPVAPPLSANWLQVGSDIDGEAEGDGSGFPVVLSLNGAVLAMGKRRYAGSGHSTGHVRVFIDTGGLWIQLGHDLDGTAESSVSLALSADGMVLAVGVDTVDGINGELSGQVRVYQWNGSVWQGRGSSIEGDAPFDRFGYAIAISADGNVLAVGALLNVRGGPNASPGNVRVFVWTGLDWVQRGNNLEGAFPFDRFGSALALSSDGSIVAGGAPKNDDSGTDHGHVRIFRWTGTSWLQLGSTLNGFGLNHNFGATVALSGDGTIVAVGSTFRNYCIVYGYDGTEWSQIGQMLFSPVNDGFGSSIALNSAGDTILIGGPSGRTGDGIRTGYALVYRLTSDQQWIQLGQGLFGDAASDSFGASVSMSQDGTRIAIGATEQIGAGYVRVFDLEAR